jgi:hypothetical protein
LWLNIWICSHYLSHLNSGFDSVRIHRAFGWHLLDIILVEEFAPRMHKQL